MTDTLEQVPTAFGITPLFCRVQPGDPARPPLVTIHGLFSNSSLFQPILPHLRAANYPTFISFDLPGFGKSPAFLATEADSEGSTGVSANRTGEHNRLVGHRMKHYVATVKGVFDYYGLGEEKLAGLVAHGEGCFVVSRLIPVASQIRHSVPRDLSFTSYSPPLPTCLR